MGEINWLTIVHNLTSHELHRYMLQIHFTRSGLHEDDDVWRNVCISVPEEDEDQSITSAHAVTVVLWLATN